jgi:hypothetical protein
MRNRIAIAGMAAVGLLLANIPLVLGILRPGH